MTDMKLMKFVNMMMELEMKLGSNIEVYVREEGGLRDPYIIIDSAPKELPIGTTIIIE